MGARRIVSLFPCLDAILAAVADPRCVAALSRYARDPAVSTVTGIWRTLPTTRGSAEELIALAPDLVLASAYTPPSTLGALRRLGIATALFDAPVTIDASLAQVARLATLIGRGRQGVLETRRLVLALARAAPPPGARRPRALLFLAGGYVAGADTLMDELLVRTGFVNAARGFGLHRTAHLDLERLLRDPPEVLFVDPGTRFGASRAQRLLAHPALAASPMKLWPSAQSVFTCGGPAMEATAAAMARARRSTIGV